MREEKYQRAKIFAIIPAAGSGTRMGHPGGKQLMDLAGESVIHRTCQAFDDSDYIDGYVVISSAESLHPMCLELHDFKTQGKLLAVIEGGSTRQDSVLHGLRYLQLHLDRHSGGLFSRQGLEARVIALVHDGARCLIRPALIDYCAKTILDERVGVAAAIRSTDTIRVLGDDGQSVSSPPRAQTILMQTPQGADLDILLRAHIAIKSTQIAITDDIHALEHINYPVRFIKGSVDNIKLTVPQDHELALFYLQKSKELE